MSIEVTGNTRPGRPALAIAVSGLLLVATLVGASVLTYVRNRPVTLTAVQDVGAVPGLRAAWPAGWTPVQLPPGPGPAVAGFTQSGNDGSDRALFLLADRISDSYVPPQYAALYLRHAAARQLRFLAVSDETSVSVEKMAGRPAFQIKYAVSFRQRVFWAVLRAVSEPSGQAYGLLLLTSDQMSPASERIVEQVAHSIQVRRNDVGTAAALDMLGIKVRSLDPSLEGLRGYPHEMPLAGPVSVTFVPGGSSVEQPYAIDLWVSWLANRRTLQDMANTWYRRTYLQADSPGESGWVQRGGTRIWRAVLAGQRASGLGLAMTLYLRELPDRRVVWARTISSDQADPQDQVLDLLASIQSAEQSDWDYDSAVSAAGSLLASLANQPVTAYYRANAGRQDFAYINPTGQQEGTGRYVTSTTPDGTISRTEEIALGADDDERIREEKLSQLQPDLSAFEVKDMLLRGRDSSLRMLFGRPDAGSPVNVRIQFSRGAPIEASFLTREPFLPDPALEPAAWQVARKPGSPVLFRVVGHDPEVPESLLLTGLGRKSLELAGRHIDAFVCRIQQDTADPSLVLFDEQGGLIGYVTESGGAFLRSIPEAELSPATAPQPQTAPAD